MTRPQLAINHIIVAMIVSIGTYYFIPQIKTVEVTRDVVHTDIQTVTHTVTLPNGNTDTTTTTIDHTKRVETDNKTTAQSIPKNWLVSGGYGASFTNPLPLYTGQLQYRILGPVFVGGGIDILGRDVYAKALVTVEF